MIGVINYGMGNIGSIVNMLKKIGAEVIVINEVEDFNLADKLILPGVGSFDNGMKLLKDKNFIVPIEYSITIQKKPLLGICLGMQLLGNASEEGILEGLKFIDFTNQKFKFDEKSNFKIPHMGWNIVSLENNHPILEGIKDQQRYYFVHSFHAVCNNPDDILLSSEYGYRFTAAVARENIIGMQFHPEKSHKFGMKIFENFVRL